MAAGHGKAGKGVKGTGEEVKKKKNPVPEFCFWYFGTIAAVLVLDASDVLFPGRTLWTFPANTSWGHLWRALELEEYSENAKFVMLGMLLSIPLHFWRTFVKSLFIPLATRGSGLVPGTLKYDKYLEQAWLAVHYTIVSCAEVFALKTGTDFWPGVWPPMMTSESRRAYLNVGVKEWTAMHHHPNIRAIYLLQFSFYFLELATLIIDKHARSRSDAFVYAIHHVLTVFLISFSFMYLSESQGIQVLFFHDLGDIFLPIAKCFVYTEDHARANFSYRTFKSLEALGVVFFVLFLITFGVCRLILFPILIYLNIYWQVWGTRDYVPARDGVDVFSQPISEWTFAKEPSNSARNYLVLGLCFLQPLHVYWFRLALRVAYRAVLGLYDDERSDDEYSDADEKKKKK